MKLLKSLLIALIAFISFQLKAQDDTSPKWLSYQFSKKVSLQTAAIQINNKPATYNDLLKIPDSSLLKVEVYSKKAAQQMVGKDEGRNGLVVVTLHKKHFPYTAPKNDSALYIINDSGDTIFCKHAQEALLDDDTTFASWIHFLQHSLKAQVPADNGAPAGIYFVDMTFLVNKDGTVSEVNVLEDPGYGTAAEVKRLMNQSPVWTPAKCDATPVIYRQKERITFAVSEE